MLLLVLPRRHRHQRRPSITAIFRVLRKERVTQLLQKQLAVV